MAKIEDGKIEKFLREKMGEILDKDEKYQEAYKKIQLLCTVYGYNGKTNEEDKKAFEEYVFSWGGRYLRAEYTNYYYSPLEMNAVFDDFLINTRISIDRVETWDKKRAKLEKKLAKAIKKGNYKKKEELENLIEEGEKRVADDRVVIEAKKKADALDDETKNCFEYAARDVKFAEKRALRQVLAEYANSDEVTEIVNNVLIDDKQSGRGCRVYNIVKDLVKEEKAILDKQEEAEKLKEKLAQRIKEEVNEDEKDEREI